MSFGRRVLLAVFLAFATVAMLDMLMTVFVPERPMQVAHLVFGEILRFAGLLAGLF